MQLMAIFFCFFVLVSLVFIVMNLIRIAYDLRTVRKIKDKKIEVIDFNREMVFYLICTFGGALALFLLINLSH